MSPGNAINDQTNATRPEELSSAASAAEVAATITSGLLTREQIALYVVPGRTISQRTIIRWEHAGLPVIKLGMIRLYDPDRCRTWLMTHERNHDVPKRGRPSAKRAA